MKTTVLALLMVITPQTRATIHRVLRPDDFDILWTANPSEAVAASARHHPGLLLLDLNQRLHEGWGTFERLRAANPDAPVVVLSDYESIYDQTVAHRKGAVLQKPVAVAILAETVDALLSAPSSSTGLEQNRDTGPVAVTTESERFRAELLERYDAPYELPAPYRYWGINE